MSVRTITIEEDEIYEQTSPTVMARVEGNDGENITQASLSEITLEVYDKLYPEEDPTLEETLVIASTVFDTLQLTTDDPRWTEDSTGFNFRHSPAASAFPTGNKTYRAEYTFTPEVGDPFCYIRDFHTIARRKV